MEIIAHRGFWINKDEKNTLLAIKKAFDLNFGIETDIRDYVGELVISHNVADSTCINVEEVFKYYNSIECKKTLALNVKADGIQILLKPLLEKYNINNYFLFDMSIPELVVNEKEKLVYYTRYSDIESECVMYDNASGVWLDAFYDDDFMNVDNILKFVNDNKKVCLVSPELHGKAYIEFWAKIKNANLHQSNLVVLCTDKPQEAREYFYE